MLLNSSLVAVLYAVVTSFTYSVNTGLVLNLLLSSGAKVLNKDLTLLNTCLKCPLTRDGGPKRRVKLFPKRASTCFLPSRVFK